MKRISLVSQEDLQSCSQAQFPPRPQAREKSLGTRLEDPNERVWMGFTDNWQMAKILTDNWQIA